GVVQTAVARDVATLSPRRLRQPADERRLRRADLRVTPCALLWRIEQITLCLPFECEPGVHWGTVLVEPRVAAAREAHDSLVEQGGVERSGRERLGRACGACVDVSRASLFMIRDRLPDDEHGRESEG